MGLETKCKARIASDECSGKLHLDSTCLSFSGGGHKVSLNIGEKIGTKIDGDWLVVSKGRQRFEFQLGASASKWLDKINHPPTRLEKLGLKGGETCWLSGTFPPDFTDELKRSGASIGKSPTTAQLRFVMISTAKDLAKISDIASKLSLKETVWFVWPKGGSEPNQNDVMKLAAECGLGPSKVASFDERLTAMRYSKK